MEELKSHIEKNSENQRKIHQSLSELRRYVKDELQDVNKNITCSNTTEPQATITDQAQAVQPGLQERSPAEEAADDDFIPVINRRSQRQINNGNSSRQITEIECA